MSHCCATATIPIFNSVHVHAGEEVQMVNYGRANLICKEKIDAQVLYDVATEHLGFRQVWMGSI